MQLIILLTMVMAMLMLELSPSIFIASFNPTALAISIPAYLLTTAILALLHSMAVIRRCRAVAQGNDPASQTSLESKTSRTLASLCNMWLLAGMIPIFSAGFGYWIYSIGAEGYPLVGEAIAIAPAILAACIFWLMEYPVHRAARLLHHEKTAGKDPDVHAIEQPAVWTLREHMEFNIRHNLLFILLPIAIIILCKDVIALYAGELFPQGNAGQWMMIAATFACAIIVFTIAPAMTVRIWKTDILPEGQLRTRLENLCRTMNMKYRKILVWQSKGVIANACVMGIIAPFRYILVSDALLKNLDEQQLLSVFGHEAGHVVRRHIPYMLLFAMATMLTSIVATTAICLIAFDPKEILDLHVIEIIEPAILITLWAGLFGPFSRRLERQSDVYGAWAASENFVQGEPMRISPQGAFIFAASLEKLAVLNGISQSKHNWRHGSIEKRIEYIMSLAESGGDCDKINRSVMRMKIILWLVFIAATAAIILQENMSV